MATDIIDLSSKISEFLTNLGPNNSCTAKNIAIHLGVPRKNIKAALYFSQSIGTVSHTLRSPFNGRRHRPVWHAVVVHKDD